MGLIVSPSDPTTSASEIFISAFAAIVAWSASVSMLIRIVRVPLTTRRRNVYSTRRVVSPGASAARRKRGRDVKGVRRAKITEALTAGGTAVVPSIPRVTVQVVPAMAVTFMTSSSMRILNGGLAGKPEADVIVIVVLTALMAPAKAACSYGSKCARPAPHLMIVQLICPALGNASGAT